jgi:DNA-binding NarL/FixJ family response regulator
MTTRHSAAEVIRILVADSNLIQNQLLTRELQRQANFRVAGCSSEFGACRTALENFVPDVVLWAESSQFNAKQVFEAIREILELRPNVRFIAMLESWDRESVVSAFRAGVRGLFSRQDGSIKSLCKCILAVYQGQTWATKSQLDFLIEALKQAPFVRVVNAKGKDLLTARQRQLVELVAEGLGNREIARQMNVSENTVKKALLRIFDKIGVSNRVELVLCALAFRRNDFGIHQQHQRDQARIESSSKVDRMAPSLQSASVVELRKALGGAHSD